MGGTKYTAIDCQNFALAAYYQAQAQEDKITEVDAQDLFARVKQLETGGFVLFCCNVHTPHFTELCASQKPLCPRSAAVSKQSICTREWIDTVGK